MNLESLEQIVGPINRGQLATSFKPAYEPATEEAPAFFSDDERQYKPPPPTEDLSHLNPPTTKKFSELAGNAWKKMTPAQRKRRIAHLAIAGKIGGSETREVKHLRGL